MPENAEPKLQLDRSDDEQVSNPEADAFFNSLVEHYRPPTASGVLNGASTIGAPQASGRTAAVPRRIADGPAFGPGAEPSFSQPIGQPQAGEFVLCSGCGSSMPAVNRLCYVCGTLRDEPQRTDVRVATPSPDLAINKLQPEPRPGFADPQRARLAIPPMEPQPPQPSTAPLFDTHYRPNTVATEVEEKRHSYTPFVLGTLMVLLAAGTIGIGWKVRYEAATWLSEFKRRFDGEMAQFRNPAPNATAAPSASVVAQRPHNSHGEGKRYSSSKRALQAPSGGMALRVSVEGQPSASTSTADPTFAAAASYSSPDVRLGPSTGGPLRIRVSPRESLQMMTKQVSPEYPPAARAGRVQGSVILKAVIGRDGRIADLDVVSGDELLIPAAREAVGQWLYRPYLVDGTPQEVETTIVVDFSLADTASMRGLR